MRTIWLVFKHDLLATLRQRSFWLLSLLLPAVLMLVNMFLIIQRNQEDQVQSFNPEAQESQELEAPAGLEQVGLVDEPGLIAQIPEGFPSDLLVHYDSQAAGMAALEAGEIDQVIVIPADYLATGQIDVYEQNVQMGEGAARGLTGDRAPLLQVLIDANLSGNPQLAVALQDPVPRSLTRPHVIEAGQETQAGPAENDQALAEVVATIIPYIYYFVLLIGSSFLMRSVVAEKENRTAELLLLRVNPQSLMVGKILAMSALTLLQLAIWFGGGWLALGRGAALFDLPPFTFPPGFIFWATLFMMLGFLLYASVMAAAGTMANTAREGSQMTWLLIIPLIPTLLFSPEFVDNPSGMLSTVLSLFPFSAPSAMVTRLAMGNVPTWQLLVSLAGLILTSYLFVVLAGRFFRPQNLLSQSSFSWRRMARGWRES